MKKIIKLAKQLIAIPSIDGNKTAKEKVLEACDKILTDYSFKKFTKDSSQSRIYYNTKKFPKKFRLVLNAHLDVVPAKTEQFKPFVKNGKLFGRGAQDMKAAAAVLILIYAKLAKTLPFPIGLQLVTDEETGGFAGTGFQIQKGIRADFVIAGESTDMQINNESKGVLWLEFNILGKAAHSAYLWNGENALVKAMSVVKLLLDYFQLPESNVWQSTCNISRIETANDTINRVPDNCKLTVDIRYIAKDLKKIKKFISSLRAPNVRIKILEEAPASFTDQNNPDIKTLVKILKKNRLPANFAKEPGSSDIRFYNALGIPAITFGPTGFGLHGKSEWVEIKSLFVFKQIVEQFVKNLKEN